MNRMTRRLGGLSTLLILVGCGAVKDDAPQGQEPRTDAHAHHVGDPLMDVTALTDHSIYHLESEWWDQHGEVQPLGSLGGRVQVISMVYTNCSYTCPRILADMKRIEAQIDDPEQVGLVLVSIDPERDTPDRLRHFADATRLDPEAWTLLSGSDGDILALAVLLGIKYRAEGDGEFAHSNAMLVLNPAGEVVYRQVGLGEDLAPMLDAIRAALPGRRSPAATH